MTTTLEQFKARVARISPEATLTIRQKCSECEGRGFGDMTASCRNCGHVYTTEELQQENLNFDPDADFQPCGCPWRHRHEDDTCYECEGTGYVHLGVTLQELAAALWRMQPSLAE
jgi:hypothetical protein